ncbi:alpha/beta hydrolase [Nocardioides sp.]|uniref:alpha/beta hydrolase n=1 Tax=Nocardioides sp. TaxID=35761 RepID=UPI002B271B89|nr:alpha/beta hydrolase [Nocardioides sp.]
MIARRGLLGLSAAGLVAALGACSRDATTTSSTPGVSAADPTSTDGDRSVERITYGEDPSQYGDLYLPQGTPRGVVVVIHGGFWRDQYDLTLGAPLATSLAAAGWAAWNLEYRRTGTGVGGGGGNPETFDDVAAGIDKLADLGVDTSTVITLGHSAGGHLATWAASRGRYPAWEGGVDVTHVISQAGVLDLVGADAANLGAGAVADLLGHAPGPEDVPLDPQQQVPLEQPVWCLHGTDDANVPYSQSEQYVAAAGAAGGTAELVTIEGGDHFVVIDVTSETWSRTLAILDTIA